MLDTDPTLRLLSDDPITDRKTLSDQLGHTVDHIVEVLDVAPRHWPILVSGDWGSGKTSVLRAVETTWKSKNAGNIHPTVWFDAWYYEDNEGLLPGLMRAVYDQTPVNFRTGANGKRLLGTLLRCAAVAGLRTLPLLATGLGAPVVAAAFLGLRAADVKSDIEATETSPFPPSDPVKELRQKLSQLITEAWGHELRPLVLIDDLDRCTPGSAVGLLDAIRLLVADAVNLRCRFVMALDRTILVQAITQKFPGIRGFDGNRYLEKVFPVEIGIDSAAGADAGALLDHVLAHAKEVGISLERTDHDALSRAVDDPTFANARLIKRIVNRLLLVLHFEGAKPTGTGATPVDEATRLRRNTALCKWIAASERWPVLREAMRRYPDQLWDDLESGALIAEPPPGAPELRSLFQEPGLLRWLAQEGFKTVEARAEYRNAEHRLAEQGL